MTTAHATRSMRSSSATSSVVCVWGGGGWVCVGGGGDGGRGAPPAAGTHLSAEGLREGTAAVAALCGLGLCALVSRPYVSAQRAGVFPGSPNPHQSPGVWSCMQLWRGYASPPGSCSVAAATCSCCVAVDAHHRGR
jgi:hypothetical protein